MIKKIVGMWLDRPFIQGLILTLWSLFSIFLFFKLPVTFYPNTKKPAFTVYISFSGIASEELHDRYSPLIEPLLQKIEHYDRIESQYMDESAEFNIEFPWSADPQVSEQAVRQVFNTIRSSLPEDSQNFWIEKSNRRSTGFFVSIFSSATLSKSELYAKLQPLIEPQLNRIPNVQTVWFSNPDEKETSIQLSYDRLISNRVNLESLRSEIDKLSKPLSAGTLSRQGYSSLPVRIQTPLATMEGIRETLIHLPNQKTIPLSSLATILEKPGDVNRFRANGKEGVLIFVAPEAGGNLNEICASIKKVVQSALDQLKDPSIVHEILVDPSYYINDAIQSVMLGILVGAFLTIISIGLFIKNHKAMFILNVSIPLSILFSIPFFYWLNLSINLVSLSGLMIAIGMVGDTSIVVFENILSKWKDRSDSSQNLKSVVLESVNQIWLPLVASVLATIVVFVPLSFTAALTYALLGDLAKIVCVLMFMSILIAIFIVPGLTLFIYKDAPATNIIRARSETILTKVVNWIGFQLDKLKASPKKACAFIGVLCILMLGCLFLANTLDREIIAAPETNKFWLRRFVESSTSIEEMSQYVLSGENELTSKYKDAIINLFSNTWSSTAGSILVTLDSIDMFKKLEPQLRKDFPSLPNMHQEIKPWNPSSLPLPSPAAFRLYVEGKNPREALRFADQVKTAIADLDLYDEGVNTIPSTQLSEKLTITPLQAQQSQIPSPSRSDLSSIVSTLTAKNRIATHTPAGQSQTIYLELDRRKFLSLEEIRGFPWFFEGQTPAPLATFADFSLKRSPNGIFYLNNRQTVQVSANLSKEKEKNKRAYYEQAMKAVKELTPPPGIAVNFEELDADFNESIVSLMKSLLISLVLIYFVLLCEFRSFGLPLIVMTAIPLAIIGVVPGLKLFQSTLSLNSILGLIILGGIVVNNSILLIDFYKRSRAQGFDIHTSLRNCIQERIRPILMTSLTTVVGLIPIVAAVGSGGKAIQPLGITVSFGLTFSTCLTLLVIPLIIYYYESLEVKAYFKKIRWLPNRILNLKIAAEQKNH